MEDPLSFADLLLALLPLLAVLWLWGLRCVLHDMRRVSPTGGGLAHCGLPRRALAPSPRYRLLARRRLRVRYPAGHFAR